MSVPEILVWIEQTPGMMVEITGGEPLLQAGVYPLMHALIEAGRPVLLETNGSLPLDRVPDQVGIIMDIKCPDSGMAARNLADNREVLRKRQERGCQDEIKFVLSSEADFHWARQMVEKEHLTRSVPVLFSPVRPLLDPAVLARLILEHRLPVRLQLQLHTLLWPKKTRGV
jgi:7-carboxy-7-deazaguanine synthase